MKSLHPSEDSVDLESEAPPFRLLIVFFQHVDVLSSKVLPVSDGFFNPFGFRDLLAEDLEESGLTTSDVSFDSEAIVFVGKLWVKSQVFQILIQTSR